ncbi:non-ribosomal peptide synthetase, partial [Actinosynnema sp. ALI-1.44]|uniref:non-ribosomal peptide synthetase n=1 Tax=Actinosynnema sp. ALI-1.44 TaxID=1933779 RepID=UPI0011787F92
MIPTAWVFLDTLPLTPNRKIDRNALPEPTAAPTQHEPPRNDPERLIAAVWQDILEIDRVGVHDNFFALGGHSLLATRITHQLQNQLHTTIPLHLLFQHPTIAELATALPATDIAEITVLPRAEENGRVTLPSSFGQERLWFLTELTPQAHLAYTMTGGATLHGPLNTTALHNAITTTIQRHETLRTTLHQHHQAVHVDAQPYFAQIDLTSETQVADLLHEQAATPFDLAEGPLFRATLARLGDDRHALVIAMHHAISDGWSLDILLREITSTYTALVDGRAPELPPLPVQYADFAAWQRTQLTDMGPSIAYWRNQLAGTTPLELTPDFPRPARQTFTGATHPVEVDAALGNAVQELAKAEGVTVFMLLLAAFQTLLARISGQHDITVGSPVAGRQHPDVANLIGFFVNTLVLRANLSAGQSFRDVLDRTRSTCLDAYAHQDVPFDKLVEELQPERDLSRSPLFQVMFVLDEAVPRYTMPGVEIEELRPEQRSSQFELTLRLAHTSTGLSGELIYNTDLFTAATAQRVADRFLTLLSALVTDPDQFVHELPVMPSGEAELLAELVRGDDTPISGRLLHEWFEAQADQTPDAIAIRATDGELTYRELDQRANQLAHHLRTGPEDLVGICLPRTLDLIVALLAVLKTGAAYVPIDPAYPKDRITYILNDANANTLITNDNHQGPWRTIPTDQTSTITTRPTTTATNNNLAYVIYTSGSTGLPKGVMIEHHHTTALITWATTTFTKAQLTNVLASTSVCFDLSVYEIFAPLAIGGSITLTENNALDLIGSNLSDLTLINTVPSVAQELLTADALPTSAATINLAGEALSPALVRALYDQPHVTAVNNLYGPSEDTTYSTHALTTSTDQRTPIGKPLHNTQAHVLDSDLRPVPYGSIGELYLGGASITRGYHQRPALTAERYLPDPHNPGKRLYRTGDLARWRPDGQLDYHGRTDHQIKHHGHRIEPAEIETTLQEHPHVTQAAVIKRNDTLCAYVVGVELDDDTTSLRNHLRATLPTHMIPTAWVFLDTLPLTPNRKIDRNALPEPTAAPTQHEPPRNDPERLIAAVWQDILEIDRVGVHDNFFALGGHSLLATRITHQLQNQLHTTIPLHLLFQHPTIAELATALPATDIAEITVLPRAEENGRVTLPSSFGQERLWFLTELTPQAHLAY